jgi:hypothetical protein
MSAILIYRHRFDFEDGAILEIVVWRLHAPVKGCTHPFKYRLYYGVPGRRLIGYDNEHPKGDHRHHGDSEKPYRFDTPEKLIEDFLADINERRNA